MIWLMKPQPQWSFLLMTYHSFPLFKIKIIQHHSLTMISIKSVIEHIHGKCLLTLIPQNKRKKWFFSRKCTKEDHPLIYFNDTSHPDYRSKTYWDVSRWKTQLQYSQFSIKILGISIEKIGFSFENTRYFENMWQSHSIPTANICGKA